MAQVQARLLPGGLPSPAGVGVAAVVGGGTFAAATYLWKTTFVTDVGGDASGQETEASNEATVAIALNGSATVSWPAPPPGVQAVNIYRGTGTNTGNRLVGTVGAAHAPGPLLGPVPRTR